MSALATRPPVLHLSFVAGRALRDAGGGRLGTVEDLIVRLENEEYPPVSGALARVADRDVFVPAERIAALDEEGIRLSVAELDLQPFRRRAGEVLLKKDVLDRQLINVEGARLVRTNEIEIAPIDGWYRVVGVDTSARSWLRRLLPRRLARRIAPGVFLDWTTVEPFTGHVPSVRLRVPHPKLARLHPADVADLVEAASHREGEEILEALRTDAEREADVFEELDPHHQVEFLEDRDDAEIAGLLERMETDDAADLVHELEEERREAVLDLLPPLQRRRLRALLGYDPATAGGLMSPHYVCVYRQATAADVLDRIRRSDAAQEALAWVFVMNERHRLRGALTLVDVVRAEPDERVGELAAPPKQVSVGADLEEVARLMTDYDLTVVPVVDEEERLLGVITVDDVLELLLPRGWRRTFGVLGED